MKSLALLMLTMALMTACDETEMINSEPGQVEDAALVGTLWYLTVLDGETIGVPDTQVPYLRFEADSSVTGFDGCNQIFGDYILSGDALTFVDLTSTLIACPDTMETAVQFFMTLPTTNRYQIDGNQLQLFDESQLLMSFVAAEQT